MMDRELREEGEGGDCWGFWDFCVCCCYTHLVFLQGLPRFRLHCCRSRSLELTRLGSERAAACRSCSFPHLAHSISRLELISTTPRDRSSSFLCTPSSPS